MPMALQLHNVVFISAGCWMEISEFIRFYHMSIVNDFIVDVVVAAASVAVAIFWFIIWCTVYITVWINKMREEEKNEQPETDGFK